MTAGGRVNRPLVTRAYSAAVTCHKADPRVTCSNIHLSKVVLHLYFATPGGHTVQTRSVFWSAGHAARDAAEKRRLQRHVPAGYIYHRNHNDFQQHQRLFIFILVLHTISRGFVYCVGTQTGQTVKVGRLAPRQRPRSRHAIARSEVRFQSSESILFNRAMFIAIRV